MWVDRNQLKLWCNAPSALHHAVCLCSRKNREVRSNLNLNYSWTNLKCGGDRGLSVAGPRLCNSLPLNIRPAQTLQHFKSLLKTHFYGLAFHTRWPNILVLTALVVVVVVVVIDLFYWFICFSMFYCIIVLHFIYFSEFYNVKHFVQHGLLVICYINKLDLDLSPCVCSWGLVSLLGFSLYYCRASTWHLNSYVPARALRSCSQLLLVQPRSRLKSRGDRAFALAAPEFWNNLPIGIRASDSIQSFKSRLKTYLFNLAFSTG